MKSFYDFSKGKRGRVLPPESEAECKTETQAIELNHGPQRNQVTIGFSSSRMMRRSVSSNLGDFPSTYSRSAALINV